MTADFTGITKKEKPKLVIKGYAATVKKIRRRMLRIAEMEEANRADKRLLISECREKRIESEKEGQFFKNCLVDGGNQDPIRITFTNKFRKIDPIHKEKLKYVIGDKFDDLFEIESKITVTDQDKISELKKILGSRFEELLDVTTSITTKKDFMEKRARLRPLMDKSTNEDLDELIQELQHQPLFSTK
jgi:hypothetical protein